jgi:crotonobetainyl-CoA:carnitine CoA-transferase CaiB-like acyl-CoA transferase
MKLEQMYHNILNYGLSALTVKVEEDSIVRSALLEAMSKIDTAPKSTRSSAPKLSEEEKSILKALGLSLADVKKLKEVM